MTPDGGGAFSVSGDQTQRIWDTSLPDALRVLEFDPELRSSAFPTRPPNSGSIGWRDSRQLIPYPSAVAFSRNKSRLAAPYLIPESSDMPAKFVLRVMDAESGRQIFSVDYPDNGTVIQVALTPEAGRLAALSINEKGGAVHLWDIASGRLLAAWKIIGKTPRVDSIALSEDGNLIAVAAAELMPLGPDTQKCSILIYQVASAQVIMSIPKSEYISALKPIFLPDRKRLAFVSGNNVHIWDLQDRKEVAVLKGHRNIVGAIAVSPDGNRIITGGPDGTVRIWDATRYESLLTLRVPSSDSVNKLTVSSDSSTIAAGTFSGAIYIWNSGSSNY